MPYAERNIGFDGRTFLEESEWLAYRRRKPVRYIRRPKTEICELCGAPATQTILSKAHTSSALISALLT